MSRIKKTINTGMKTEVLGQSSKGHDLLIHYSPTFRKGNKLKALIIGGTHGNERATVTLLNQYIKKRLPLLTTNDPIGVFPLMNPDGYQNNSRFNAAGIDLNRNFPGNWSPHSDYPPGSGPLSEPESKAIFKYIMTAQPKVIVSLHWALSEIDADGSQSLRLANKMFKSLAPHEKNWYRVRHTSRRQRTPISPSDSNLSGSLGNWCGYHLRYPNGKRPAIITLELPYTYLKKKISHPLPQGSFHYACRLWNRNPNLYLKIVGPSVFRMLGVVE